MSEQNHRVVILGGGFGGLSAVEALEGSGASITLIDQRNHHLFQPLLYQVATAALGAADIAWPIRHILRHRTDVTTLLATVTGIDTVNKSVRLDDGRQVPFDSLIVATGARHAYFGNDAWEEFAPGLKTLEDAIAIRRRLLVAFEAAEQETDPQRRQALLTFAVVGAGPTGVEMAGSIIELAHDTLRGEFRNINTSSARVVLVEAADRVLLNFDKELSAYTLKSLRDLGVEVMLGKKVTGIDKNGIDFGDERLEASTIIWAAGVAASPAAKWLNVEPDRAGRVKVLPDLTIAGHPEIFVVGDVATISMPDGKPVPGVAPAAKQGGAHAARVIRARLAGDQTAMPFKYKHTGDLATIGKRSAVIDFGRIKLKGWVAWWIWGLAHIYFLLDLKNRLFVALNWLWIYLSGQRRARLITHSLVEPSTVPNDSEVDV